MDAQIELLNSDTLAVIQWLGLPEGAPFPLARSHSTIEPSPRAETLARVEMLASEIRAWDDAMLLWVKVHCAFREHSWGSLSRLYVSHIEHAHQSGGMFAPDRETFQAILMALGFQTVDEMCYGLILKEDRPSFPITRNASAPANGGKLL